MDTQAMSVRGLHHVTAITADAQRNLDFYTGTLGLRLVKLTVNFDDPSSYHFYYGDALGTPGSILTFFVWPGAPRGRRGTGQAAATTFAIPEGALAYWRERLGGQGIAVETAASRFGDEVLTFADPDGMALELVARSRQTAAPTWAGRPVPAEQAIQGIDGVTVEVNRLDPTAALLTGALGFELRGEDGNRVRYVLDRDDRTAVVDLILTPRGGPGTIAAGNVHHVAWRTPDDATQLLWRDELTRLGLQVSPVLDRMYFHSIYFREPSGVLFEIATDPPGFATDETIDHLGERLTLPPWYESAREEILQVLPPLRLPTATEVASS